MTLTKSVHESNPPTIFDDTIVTHHQNGIQNNGFCNKEDENDGCGNSKMGGNDSSVVKKGVKQPTRYKCEIYPPSFSYPKRNNNACLVDTSFNSYKGHRLSKAPSSSFPVVVAPKGIAKNQGSNNSSPYHTVAAKIDGRDGDREQWSHKLDFLLSIIGFAVDLANIWRFPYLCYKNGGGAFLIPYVIMLVFAGIPLLYLELALGQYNQAGAVGIWKMVPLLKGTGYASILICFYVSTYYPVIIGYSFYYLFSSFKSVLPWADCNNSWNTPTCKVPISKISSFLNYSSITNQTLPVNHTMTTIGNNATAMIVAAQLVGNNYKTPSEEFFERKVLGVFESEGFHHMTSIKWDITLAALLVYVAVFLALIKGIRSSGKVVWFSATVPYVLLVVMLIRSLFLPGATTGILYYLTPDINRLKSGQVWFDAAVQIFYSSGPGFGVHIAYASYNKFHNNIQSDAIITSIVNSLTSFLAGFVVFAFLGYMAYVRGVGIDQVAQDGPGLVFIVYPEALTLLKWSSFFAIIFFITLVSLGFDSILGGLESVITGIYDDIGSFMKRKRIPRMLLTGLVLSVSFGFSLLNTTKSGIYWITFLDFYSAGTALLFVVLIETVAVTWIYGDQKFANNIEEMIGHKPNFYWRFCWKYASPILLIAMIIYGFISAVPLQYGSYIYSHIATIAGWCIAILPVALIPLIGIVIFIKTRCQNLSTKKLTLKNSVRDGETGC